MLSPDQSLLLWDSEKGIGYYPVDDADEPYKGAGSLDYFQKYVRYAETPLGGALTKARLAIVDEFLTRDKVVVDIGCGAGQFIQMRGENTYGVEVNQYAIGWLSAQKKQWLGGNFPNATFFDVFEHLPHPHKYLRLIKSHVFISIPIFHDREHVLHSRHFRIDEHRWYFTSKGLVKFLSDEGFYLLVESVIETKLGREDIGFFAFRRR